MTTELPKTDFAIIDSINSINFKPHPYTIGTRHIKEAQKYGGILDKRTLKDVRCAVPYCNLSYEEHTSDRVAFIKLTRDCSNNEMTHWLQKLVDKWTTVEKVDGFIFVETIEGFRIGK